MPPSSSHSAPSTYALEKAVRLAVRTLGRSASTADVERAALQLLADEGYRIDPGTPSSGQTRLTPPASRPNQMAAAPSAQLHLSISAACCTSRRRSTQRARLYDLLRKELLGVPENVRQGVHLHVRDTSSLLVGHQPDMLLLVAETLAAVVEDIPVSGISGPFIDGALVENLPLIEKIPDLVGLNRLVCPTVQIGTRENGHPEATVSAVALALAVASSDGSAEGPVIISVNDCDRRAFGHRVHPETVVAYSRPSLKEDPASFQAPSRDAHRLNVATADLPLVAGTPPERSIDHMHRVGPSSPEDIQRLLEEHLLKGASSGVRRQMLLHC